jgi:hypothetical protein
MRLLARDVHTAEMGAPAHGLRTTENTETLSHTSVASLCLL